MVTLYKDGAHCTANPEQVDLMVAAGWSTEQHVESEIAPTVTTTPKTTSPAAPAVPSVWDEE